MPCLSALETSHDKALYKSTDTLLYFRLRLTQLLRPRAKKLTLIDARRVMSIYEETTRRVQLVGGLLEQTSITAAVKRLGASLGADLVDALTQYSSILDLFDEVVSWREMAISDTRGPVAPAGAGVARTSIGSTREDSIFAMLFRPDDDSLEPLPDVASSILFQARSYSTSHTHTHTHWHQSP